LGVLILANKKKVTFYHERIHLKEIRQQMVFTYLVPILPLFIAWGGAVSNARTYTLEDMGELIQGLSGEKYSWDMEKLKGKEGNICIYWGSK